MRFDSGVHPLRGEQKRPISKLRGPTSHTRAPQAAVAKGFTAYLSSLIQVDLGHMRLQWGLFTLGETAGRVDEGSERRD